MPTKREIGYRLYGRQSKQRTSVSSASRVGATTEASSQVRYGFAQADSTDGKVPVKLDNSDSVVTCTCDSIIKQGDRVKVIVTESGQLIALPIGNNLVDYVDKAKEDLAQQIIDKGTEIMESVSEDIAEVNEAVAAAEEKADGLAADLQVTNTTITALSTRVDGVAEDAAGAMTAASTAQQDLDGFRQTVEQHYQTKDAAADAMAQEVLDRNSAIEQSATQIKNTVKQDYQSKQEAGTMEQELQTQITQTAQAVTTEVTNRTKAVNDALVEAKTYTETYAGGIKTELEGEFQSELGSYYSKTEINAKFDGVETTITAAVSDAAYAKELAEATEAVADEAKELAEKNGLDDAIPEYAKSNSGTTAPSSGWSTSLPSYSKGSYTWLRYRMVAKDGSVTYSTPQRFETADEAMLVSTYFNESVDGLTVGRIGQGSAIRLGSDASLDFLSGDDELMSMYLEDSTCYFDMSTWASFCFKGYDAQMRINNGGLALSTHYPGFSINGLSAVETCQFVPTGDRQTDSFNADLSGSNIVIGSIDYVVVYYYDLMGYGHRSIKAPITSGGTTSMFLVGHGTSPNSIIEIREGIEIELKNGRLYVNRGVVGPIRVNVAATVGVNTAPGDQFRIERISFCTG